MITRKFGWNGFVLSLMLGLGGLVGSGNAVAQTTYWGDNVCGGCHFEASHTANYSDYKQHGHAWMEVHTGGAVLSASNNPFASLGFPLPSLPSAVKSWTGVQDIVANFHPDIVAGGVCNVLCSDGKLYESAGSSMAMPAKCNNCHNTGFDPNGHAYGTTTIAGSWSLNGIQCENCHGPGGTMAIPTGQVCRDCHSSGDQDATGAFTFRIPVDPATLQFTNHHPEGDEYRRSPHKDLGCTACHDAHKSVWYDKGGILVNNPAGGQTNGTMCLNCHVKRIRGAMGDLGLECVDCHMPELTGATAGVPHSGTRATHIFRINGLAVSGSASIVQEANSSGKMTNYWAPTDPNGDASLTLDQVCTQCHSNMTLTEMSNYAQTIHMSGMVDITVNGSDEYQTVSPTQPVTVAISVEPGADAGVLADWYVSYQGPKGWMSWNGSAWKSGLKPWRKGVALANVSSTTVMNAKLPTGQYTFWISIYPTGLTEDVSSVPLYVSKK